MSHGGEIALIFALQDPHRARTLMLIEPPAFWVLPNHGRDDKGARETQLATRSYSIGDDNDDPARLRRLTMSALIVTGAETVVFHRRINEALIRALQHAEALYLDAGHNSPTADPDHFIAEWQKFQERANTARR